MEQKLRRGRPGNEKYASAKRLIASIKDSHRDWPPSKIREQTFAALHKYFQKKHPGWTNKEVENAAEKYLPSTSWIRDYLREDVDPQINKPDPLEKPWHLGTLRDYPLAAEAIPYIFWVQAHATTPVTVRQAIWISRLRVIIKKPLAQIKDKDKPTIAIWLNDWSKTYATHEVICKISRTPFDTSMLDKALREGSKPIATDSQWVIFNKDKSFAVDPKTVEQLGNSEKEGE